MPQDRSTPLHRAILAARVLGALAATAIMRMPRVIRRTLVAARASTRGIRGRYAQTLYARPSDLRMHPLGIAMLEEAGVDRTAYGRTWLDRDGGTAAGPQSPFTQQAMLKAGIGFSMDLGPTASFNSGCGGDEGTVAIRNELLPDTVMLGLAGRMMDEIVDHPLFRGRGCRVAYVHHNEAGDATVVRMHPMAWESIIPSGHAPGDRDAR